MNQLFGLSRANNKKTPRLLPTNHLNKDAVRHFFSGVLRETNPNLVMIVEILVGWEDYPPQKIRMSVQSSICEQPPWLT
jgi:hypothetical protein